MSNEAIKDAFAVLKAALQADDEYAWSWHCNIAMAFVDTEPEYGGRNLHRSANEGAAIFMQRCFNIDVRQSRQWKSLFSDSGSPQPSVGQ